MDGLSEACRSARQATSDDQREQDFTVFRAVLKLGVVYNPDYLIPHSDGR